MRPNHGGSSRVVAIVQARTGSSRLPRKVMLDLWGKPVLERVCDGVRRSTTIHKLLVATSTLAEDDVIEWTCDRLGVTCARGSPSDVRSRYIAAAAAHGADIVVRVTADNPLTEARFIDQLVGGLTAEPDWDYCLMDAALVAHGTGSEVFRVPAFLETAARDGSEYAREHVTPCLKAQRPIHTMVPPDDLAVTDFNVSIDTLDDYLRVAGIFARYRGDQALLPQLVADVRRDRTIHATPRRSGTVANA